MPTFDSERTAVVVVDMQNGFCDPEGSLYAPTSGAAVEPCVALAARARDAGARLVYTRDVHPEGQFDDTHYYDEFERWGEHVVEGSWDAELITALPEPDHVVEKHTYDGFYRTDLDGDLDAHGVTDLVICGTLANVCVLHTAASAGLRDYRPVVVEDALGYLEKGHHDYATEHASWLFGETTTREDVAFA